jgi:uncharacterized protein YvpB
MSTFIKKYAISRVDGTGDSFTPILTPIFEVPEGKTYVVMTTEITSNSNALVYLKQIDSDNIERFSVKYDMEKNDYVVFTHKLVFTQFQKFSIYADSDDIQVAAHILEI